MNDEEVAFRIVRLYFEEIARLGFKRQLDLDQMINAYFYALKRLKAKDAALKKFAEDIAKGKDFKEEEKEISKSTTTTTVATTVSKEVTGTNAQSK